MKAGIKMNDPKVKALMPRTGDMIVDVINSNYKRKFRIIKEYTNFYLSRNTKTGVLECFQKVCFMLNEYIIIPNYENLSKAS